MNDQIWEALGRAVAISEGIRKEAERHASKRGCGSHVRINGMGYKCERCDIEVRMWLDGGVMIRGEPTRL